MSKKAVKVVKRNDAPVKKQVFVNHAEVEDIARRKIEGVINDWIFERRENSRTEKAVSAREIKTWKTIK